VNLQGDFKSWESGWIRHCWHFLRTTDEDERERLLRELTLEYAAPLVRQALRYKLKFYVGKEGNNPTNPDAEDLYQDILAKLVKMLSGLQPQSASAGIKDFRQYIIRVAVNTCNDHLRSKYPMRTRLKDKVRDLLERHQDFELWKTEQDEMICGFVGWHAETKVWSFSEQVVLLEEHLEDLKQKRSARPARETEPLTHTISDLFEWTRRPIELESLVNAIAYLLNIKDQQPESVDDESSSAAQHLTGKDPDPLEILEDRAAFHSLWNAVRQLPVNQRNSFVFSFADSKGDDLLSLLFDAGVVTPAQIAKELDLPLDRLMAIWKEMPMRNVDVAALFGVERQMVNKWRHRAIKQLEKHFLGPK
jgi:RNA polymerase sigma factor (sigma-70 family)